MMEGRGASRVFEISGVVGVFWVGNVWGVVFPRGKGSSRVRSWGSVGMPGGISGGHSWRGEGHGGDEGMDDGWMRGWMDSTMTFGDRQPSNLPICQSAISLVGAILRDGDGWAAGALHMREWKPPDSHSTDNV